jgi:hypothetical protein
VSTVAVEQTTLEGLELEPTLDELIAGIWPRLCAHSTVECPLCDGEMAPVYAAQALPVGGRCSSCGTTLN